MIKNLIFDFGKVLVDYDYMLVLDQVFSTHEQSVDFYNHIMAEGWNKRLDREDKPFGAVIDDMAEEMPQYADEIRQFGSRYTEFVIGEMEGMRSLLGQLKQEGYRLFGLTNWCSKVHVTMKQYPIFELLEGRLVSSEEHLIKPERAIYERMCEKLALKPEECVCADDRMDNIEAARDYGMRGIVFRNARQYEADLRRILDIESRVERAVDNFMQGYGCCQSVVAAFGDMYGLDDNLAKRIGAGFGGFLGCGFFSALAIIGALDTFNDSILPQQQVRFFGVSELICGVLFGLMGILSLVLAIKPNTIENIKLHKYKKREKELEKEKDELKKQIAEL